MKLFILFPAVLLFLSTSTKGREYHYEKPPTAFLANMGVQQIYSPPQAVNGANYNAPRTINQIVRTHGPSGQDYAVQMSRSNEIFEGHQAAAQQQIGGRVGGGGVTQGYLPPVQVQTQQQIQASAGRSGGQYYSQSGSVSGVGNLQHSSNVNPLTQTHYSQTQVQTNQGSYTGSAYAGASYSGNTQQPGAAYTGATYSGPSQAGPTYAGISHQGATFSGTSYSGTAQPGVAYTATAQPASYSGTAQPGITYTAPAQPASYSGISQPGAAYSGTVQSSSYAGTNQPGVAYTAPVQPAAYASQTNTGVAYSGAAGASASYSGSSYSNIPQSGGNPQYNPSTYAQTSSNTGFNTNLIGGGNEQFGNTGTGAGKIGDYVSQSEAAALDYYTHKQENGDTRPFARHITTCNQSGKCDQLTLPPGQPDANHQQTILAARARIAPVSDKCQRIAQAKAGGASYYAGGSYYRHSSSPLNTEGLATGPNGVGTSSSSTSTASASSGKRVQPGASGANRPHDRRLFQYSEVEIPQDPFN